MNIIRRLALSSIALLSLAAAAQDSGRRPQPTPEEMEKIMQATMGAMVSVMGPMTDAVLEAQLNSAAKPETAERLAAFKRNLYNALLKQGFAAEEALQIVVVSQPPSASPAMK